MSAAFAAPAADAAGEAVISIRELTKLYGELAVVDGISFEVRRGEGSASSVPTRPARRPPSRCWRAAGVPTPARSPSTACPCGPIPRPSRRASACSSRPRRPSATCDFNRAIVKLDDGMVANVMVQAFKNADGITVSQPATEDEALSQLKDGKVQGVLVLPPDRQRSFAEAGATTRLAFHYDNSDLATAGQVVGLTQRVVESVGNGIAQVQPKLASDRWA